MAEYAPHGDPGSMLDTTKPKGLEVKNLQPSGRRLTATQALMRLKGAKRRKKKRKRPRLVGAARAGSVAVSQPKRKRRVLVGLAPSRSTTAAQRKRSSRSSR